MRKTGICALLLTSFLSVLPLASCGGGTGETPEFPDDKTMHVGAWVSPPPEYINDNTYREIAESGINTIYALYESNIQQTMQALDAAKNNGLGYYVRDWSVSALREDDYDMLPDVVAPYKDHPAFRGHLIADEPGPSKFQALGALHEAYRKLLPGKDYYINLFPTYSSLAQRDGKDYKEYLSEYVKTVKPAFLSFDHYALKKNTDGTAITEDFLYNLDLVTAEAKKAGIPVWSFIQSIEFSTAGSTNRLPDEADIRWQVYANLAFGVQGLQYFCYWTPDNDGLAIFSSAMIDRDGKKTPVYDAVKNVNREVAAFDHILLSMKSKGVMTAAPGELPADMHMENPLKSWEPVRQVTAEHGALIGAFEGDGGTKAMILVNYTDPGKKQTNRVSVELKGVKGLTVFEKDGPVKAALKKNTYEVQLQPGEGKFILFNQ